MLVKVFWTYEIQNCRVHTRPWTKKKSNKAQPATCGFFYIILPFKYIYIYKIYYAQSQFCVIIWVVVSLPNPNHPFSPIIFRLFLFRRFKNFKTTFKLIPRVEFTPKSDIKTWPNIKNVLRIHLKLLSKFISCSPVWTIAILLCIASHFNIIIIIITIHTRIFLLNY